MAAASASLRRLRYELRSAASCHPILFLPLLRWFRRHYRDLLVDSDTEVVIEGFPRSGNTFSYAALALAQNRPVRVARHTHASAQVVAAVRRNVPTIVLIRPPRDAAVSLLVWEQFLSPRDVLKDYLRFYETVLPYREGFVVAHFQQVVTDFGQVIHNLNSRFGTSFELFSHTDENVAKCFELVEQLDREHSRRSRIRHRLVARPSQKRDEMKRQLVERFADPDVVPALAAAEEIYDRYIEKSRSSPRPV